MVNLQDILDSSRIAAGGLKDFATGLINPTVRLGVTGLSRSGKTVFITALVKALLDNGRLPLFEAQARGRITNCYLEPQPDDSLPRFPYEDHLASLTSKDRRWPESTRRISQLRITFDYVPHGLIAQNIHGGKLHLDIVDYPGEWLLDLPLMNMTYQQWSNETIGASHKTPRREQAKEWHALLPSLKPDGPADELKAVEAARIFTSYLARCRKSEVALSSLPPGRFLMPGDLEGSPLLSFAPLDLAIDHPLQAGSLAKLMARRYEAYVSHVVKPFFFDHFARLNRQIVLVDTLTALNAGSAAVVDLQTALTNVMSCFRQGSNSAMSMLFGRRIDKILFAATKADQLHHSSHDRLEHILRILVQQAASKADFAGATHSVIAMAAIRATREATVRQNGNELACIAGAPERNERIGQTLFDGDTEAAIFPGDLPPDPLKALDGSLEGALKFVRFRPPVMHNSAAPHIRLDRAVEFLIGDSFA